MGAEREEKEPVERSNCGFKQGSHQPKDNMRQDEQEQRGRAVGEEEEVVSGRYSTFISTFTNWTWFLPFFCQQVSDLRLPG